MPVDTAMHQIADWLGKMGMSEYAQRFAENNIDFAILGDLTDQDLKEVGVSSLGHRQLFARLPISKASRRARLLSPLRLLHRSQHDRRMPPSAAKSR